MELPKGDFNTWPSEMLTLWAMQTALGHVTSSVYEEAIKNCPEYFTEELEYRRIYDSIPKEVHEAYLKECRELFNEWRETNPTRGLYYYLDHQDEYREYNERYKKYREEVEKPREKEIWEKYYGKYNLKQSWK